MAEFAKLHYTMNGVDQTVVLPAGSFCDIGRDAASKLRIDPGDTTASRRHAIVRADHDGRCALVPVSTTTVTLRNGRPITAEVPLVHGDVISIGQTVFRFDAPFLKAGATGNSVAGATGNAVAGATVIALSDNLVTTLVVDIRGYSVLAQEIGEVEIGKLMRRFNVEAGAILNKFGVYQTRYLGDAVMAAWHHGPSSSVASIEPADLGRAISAYLALSAMAAQINADMVLPRPLSIGGGLNTGYAVVGNLGNAGQIDFNTIGEAVNRAFRLEAATRTHNAALMIGHACLDFLSRPFQFPSLYPVTAVELKGYALPQRAMVLQSEDVDRLAKQLAG